MTSYPTIKNPLIPSPPPKRISRSRLLSSFSSSSTLKTSVSTSTFCRFMSKSLLQLSNAKVGVLMTPTRRIMPTSKPLSSHSDLILADDKKKKDIFGKAKASVEPAVHYNGPCYTIDQLSDEKLAWIRQEHTAGFLGQNLKNTLSNYGRFIVLCKPYASSQAITNSHHIVKKPHGPKAMFYLRILQVTNTESSKSCKFRCSVQVNQEFCMSSYVTSEKRGKSSTEANFDETFLFDVSEPTTATISLYSQPRSASVFNIRGRADDICVGEESFHITLDPKEKHFQRFEIHDKSQPNKYSSYQVLAVFGMYISQRAQILLNDTILIADYVTVYVQGPMAPKRERFWAVLRGVKLEMYDFEYREARPTRYILPLDTLVEAFYPNMNKDDRHQMMNESHCLALQFSENSLSPFDEKSVQDDLDSFEYRMYMLADTAEGSHDWLNALNFAASIFDELHNETHGNMDNGSFTNSQDSDLDMRYSISSCTDHSNLKTIPAQLLW
ncbi:hypothetical protein CLU79DRAFT_764070 [Phycomyces nitens]|nr:hypothetical protein CLU79DRAFT_764070 [Phycomyces nitens]